MTEQEENKPPLTPQEHDLEDAILSFISSSLPENPSGLDLNIPRDKVEQSILAFFDAEKFKQQAIGFFPEEELKDALNPQKPQE